MVVFIDKYKRSILLTPFPNTKGDQREKMSENNDNIFNLIESNDNKYNDKRKKESENNGESSEW